MTLLTFGLVLVEKDRHLPSNVSYQQTDSQNYGFGYGFNLSSEITSETYPYERVVQSEYDTAGRLAGVKNQATQLFYALTLGEEKAV